MSEKDRPLSRASLETTTSERLAAIVEAAEQAAAKVIDDAEEQARRYLADARAEADRRARGAVLLARRRDRLAGRPGGGDPAPRRPAARSAGGGAGASSSERAAGRARADVPPRSGRPAARARLPPERRGAGRGARPETSRSESHPVRESPAGARLLATQMAVSGSSREEIAARLRNGFEIEDTDAILDAILGAEE